MQKPEPSAGDCLGAHHFYHSASRAGGDNDLRRRGRASGLVVLETLLFHRFTCLYGHTYSLPPGNLNNCAPVVRFPAVQTYGDGFYPTICAGRDPPQQIYIFLYQKLE
jgi:hypothetical protein